MARERKNQTESTVIIDILSLRADEPGDQVMMMIMMMMMIIMVKMMMMTIMARYEIRTATKVGYLTGGEFEVKGILVHPSLTPAPGVRGARERGVVRVPWPNQVFYYAVVAIDEVK